MTERLATPLYSRAITSELLFEAYGVPSVTYGVDSLFAFEAIQARRKGLLSSGMKGRHGKKGRESAGEGESGLVVNMGHMSTTLIPVLNGKSLMNRAKRYVLSVHEVWRKRADCRGRIPWGGSQASDLTLRLMQLKYPGFPMRVSQRQATVCSPLSHTPKLTNPSQYISHKTLHFATDYPTELSALSDPQQMSHASTSVQFPYPVPDVVQRSDEELAAMAEKRKEQGKKLQEITQKRNRERVSRGVLAV